MKLIAAISTFLMFLGGIFGTKDFVSSYKAGSLTFLQAEETYTTITDKIEATKDRRIALLKEKQSETIYDFEMFSRAPLDDREWKKMQADMHLEEDNADEEVIEIEEKMTNFDQETIKNIVVEEEEISEAITSDNTAEIITASMSDEIILDEILIETEKAEENVIVEPSLEIIDFSELDASMFSRAPLDYDFENIEPIVLEDLDKKKNKKNK